MKRKHLPGTLEINRMLLPAKLFCWVHMVELQQEKKALNSTPAYAGGYSPNHLSPWQVPSTFAIIRLPSEKRYWPACQVA